MLEHSFETSPLPDSVATTQDNLKQTQLHVSVFDSPTKSITDVGIALHPKLGDAVKSVSDHIIGGYLIRWGSPNERDQEGDYFTPDVYLGEEIYGENTPVYVEHSFLTDENGELLPPQKTFIGRVCKRIKDNIGLWVEAKIEDSPLAQSVVDAIRNGVMSWSSGSIAHMVRRDDDSRIVAWPLVDATTTDNPAELRDTDIYLIKSAYAGQPVALEALFKTGLATNEPSISLPSPTLNESRKDKANVLNSIGLYRQHYATIKTLFDLKYPQGLDSIAALKADVTDEPMPPEEEAKQEGDLTAQIRPVAEMLAQLTDGNVDNALAACMLYIANVLTPAVEMESEVPQPMEAADGAYTTPEMMSADKSAKSLSPAVGNNGGVILTPNRAPVVNRTPRGEPEIKFGKYLAAVARNDGYQLSRWKTQIEASYKAQGLVPDTAGGYLVPHEYSNQIIDLLYAKAQLLDVCTQWPMTRDIVEIPKLTSGVTPAEVGENSTINATEVTVGQVKLIAKKLAAMVKVSNEVLEDSDPAIEGVIRNDIAKQMAIKIDQCIIQGTGIGEQPLGIINVPGVTSTAQGGALADSDVLAMIQRLEDANVDYDESWAWLFTPTIKRILKLIKSGAAGDYFWLGGGGYGQPAVTTTPNDLQGFKWMQSTLGPTGTMILGRWGDCVVGIRKQIEVISSNVAGTAFETDQTWIRAVMRWDMVLRHVESFQVLTGVTS